MDFSDNFVSFKRNGTEHLVKKPNNKETKEYQIELSKSNENEHKEKTLQSFLEKLGLKKEVYEELTPYQTKKLVEELFSFEKN